MSKVDMDRLKIMRGVLEIQRREAEEAIRAIDEELNRKITYPEYFRRSRSGTWGLVSESLRRHPRSNDLHHLTKRFTG
jgi:hypothetical protein